MVCLLSEVKRKVKDVEVARKSGRLLLAREEGAALKCLKPEGALRVRSRHEGRVGSHRATSSAVELGEDIPGHLRRCGKRLLGNGAVDGASEGQPQRRRVKEDNSHAIDSEHITKLE